MKKIFFLAALMIGAILPSGAAAATNFVQASGTRMFLGTKEFIPAGFNVQEEKSLWDRRRKNPVNTPFLNDFRRFKALGMNSVRLAVKADYFASPAGFKWLDARVREAKAAGIKILLDMHMPVGGAQQDYQPSLENQKFWDDVLAQVAFIKIWGKIAQRYSNEPTIWGYDIMNEPTSRNTGQVTALYQSIVNEIRTKDKNHLILIQPVQIYDSTGHEEFIYPKVMDPNLAYDVHFYKPYSFTVQNVPWGINDGRVIPRYPQNASGTEAAWDNVRLSAELAKSGLIAARESSVPAIIGEFGAVFHEQLRGQYFWIEDVLAAARQAGVGWHYWIYKTTNMNGGFGLTDGRGNERKQTIRLLSSWARLTGR